MAASPTLLLADIGGTNARFCLYRDGAILDEPVNWLAALHPDLTSAMAEYLEQTLAKDETVDGVSVCGAGPVFDGRIDLTNSPWIVDAGEIAAATHVDSPVVVNDFKAQAMGVIRLTGDQLAPLGNHAELKLGQPIGVIGPGTGLGVSGLIPDRHGRYSALSGEGGHVDLAPSDEREIAILFQLMKTHGHVSAEKVLSGPGLENLFVAIAEVDGVTEEARPAAVDIAARAESGTCKVSKETLRLFTRWLGAVSGNLALTLGAQGGVVVTGGILPKWGDLFDKALFRAGFEAKGRFRDYLAPVPTVLVTGGHPAMLGLATLWEDAQG